MKKKVKKVLYSIIKKNYLLRTIYRCLKYNLGLIKYKKIMSNTKVDNKLILFESYMGRSYSCNPKAIYEYLINNSKYNEYKFIWIFKSPERYKHLINKRTTVIKYNSREYFQSYAKSKYWICNSQIPLFIKKKEEQIFLQTWHGTPLKRLRCDIEIEGAGSAINNLKEIKRQNDVDSLRFDYFISPSKYASAKFLSAFNLEKLNKENIILETGYPRNDFLFNYKAEDINRIKKKIGIKSSKKIILYAPTYRDHDHSSEEGYIYKLGIDFDKLKKEFASDYVILFRTHYFVSNYFNFSKYKGFIYDVSNYDDISDLYVISDLLITDYSSVFFDYANLKRPIIYYMYDYESYKNELRGFYFDINELPGIIVCDEDKLIDSIKNIDKFTYDQKYKDFNNKFNYLDDGNCSERVINEILEIGE